MADIINGEKKNGHKVDKYNFKVLSFGEEADDEFAATSFVQREDLAEAKPSFREREVDSSAMSQSSKDSLIESLLNKTDEMSSNFIKLQMKLESMMEEHKAELKKVKEESFAAGVESGKERASKEEEKKISEAIAQYGASIGKLEKSAGAFEAALERIKEELVSAALDISKETIRVELSENSHKVATLLAQELIKELQGASKIVLRVNPNDHGAISQAVGTLAHVEIVSDGAVSLGGVIAMSEAGNIDAQIAKRFERVKRAALSE
ncbi:MAG: flagellar assembly protein FliH [Sulfurimonas sp.]|nr:flagellar assembly protein FliH [Sulfurimonas sp.]